MPGETGGQAFCQVRHVGQSTLPGEQVVVPGYTVGQAVLQDGTGEPALVQRGSCKAV